MTIRTMLLALLPLPALAQDVSDEDALLDAFAARCDEVAADPRAAVNATLDDPEGEALGAMTADGAMAHLVEHNLGVAEPDGLQSVFTFALAVVAGEARSSCHLSVFRMSDAEALADMAAVLALRAPEVLGGPAVQAGGGVISGGQLGQLLLWHRADLGADGPTLTLTQDGASLALGLGRVGPVP